MKVQTSPAAVQAIRQKLLRWSGNRAAELAIRTFGALATGFVLAGAKAAGGLLPLSVCLAAALGLGLPSFGAYIGGCLGYVAFFGPDAAVEPMAVGLLAEACLCIFGEEPDREHPWFAPGCVMLFSALVGVLFLLQNRLWSRLLWRYLLKIAVAGLGTWGFRKALSPERSEGNLLLPVCLTAGLCALPKETALAAVHDAARPLISQAVIDRTVRAAHSYGAAAPAIPVKDTIKVATGGVVTATPDRSKLRAVQTPQVFDLDLLKAALKKAQEDNAEVTDDCSAVERLEMSVKLVEGDERNIKVTTPVDLKVAALFLEELECE